MKNTIKKLCCILLAVVFAFSLTACFGGNESTEPEKEVVKNDEKLLAFIDSQGAIFEEAFEESFKESSGGLTCKCEFSVEGTTLTLTSLVDGINDVPEETKAEMQEAYDASKEELTENFKEIKNIVPSLSAVIMKICEEDGDVLASVKVDY